MATSSSTRQPYRGKPAVRNDRGDRGNVGIIRSPVRASILPDHLAAGAVKLFIEIFGLAFVALERGHDKARIGTVGQGADGVAVFNAIHRRHRATNAMLYAFDLLELNGKNLGLDLRRWACGHEAPTPRSHANFP
jgi:hypothetical protein